MKSKVEIALEDVIMIKKVIEKTQQDFSRISSFFLWIGIINFLVFILEQISYYIRNIMGLLSSAYMALEKICIVFPIIAYIVCFLYFRKKIIGNHNDISNGMLKVWGIILIGSYIFKYLYIMLLPGTEIDFVNGLWRCSELIIFLPIIFGHFMTAILTKSRFLIIVTCIESLIFFALFTSMREVPYGTLGGIGTRVSLSSAFVRIVMILGMILLGIYLKKRGSSIHGNKYDTGSISN